MGDQYKKEVIDPGDAASALAKELGFASHKNGKAIDIIPRQPGNFRGAVDFRWKKHVLEAMLAGLVSETVQNDGAGGKLGFHSLVNTPHVFYEAPWEIICMCVDDIARSGGLPVLIDNDINAKMVTKENFHLVKALFEGFEVALQKSGLVNITGEFAIMRYSVTSFCDKNDPRQLVMNWSGSSIGLSHENKKIDGSSIQPGMPIIGFWEPGYRCNGGTFFINLINSFDFFDKIMGPIGFADKLCTPSQSYAKTISRVHGWLTDGQTVDPLVKIHGIAHITGGGIWAKLSEILPSGVGANLDKMLKPADVLREAQDMSWDIPNLRLTDEQAHGTLHGGFGMLIVCESKDDANKLIEEAKKDGIIAAEIGETTSSEQNEILIQSRFREGRELSSLHLVA